MSVEALPGEKPLQPLPDRLKLRAVILQRGRGIWRVGTGSIAVGAIDANLSTYPTELAAHQAALALADQLDLLAVRT